MTVVLFIGGSQLIRIGVLGEYIERLYHEPYNGPSTLCATFSIMPDVTVAPLRRLHWLNCALVCVALFLVATLPVWPNWWVYDLPLTHEGYRYSVLLDMFAQAQGAGALYPRWLTSLNGAWGYPTFVFYQPGYFFLAAPFVWLTDDFLLRQLLSLSLIALIAGVGMYLLARRWLSTVLSVTTVAVFQLAPYSHINLYLRGDLSEWMVLQWAPWPLLFLKCTFEASESRNERLRFASWIGLAISTAVMAYCHPIAVIFLPILVMLVSTFGWLCLDSLQSRTKLLLLGEVAAAEVIGLALSSPYWASVAVMKPFVNHQLAAVGVFEATENWIGLKTLLFGSFLAPETINFSRTEFLGAPFVLLALFGAWNGRREPFLLAVASTYLLIILAITEFGKPLWALKPFSYLQFPWRLAAFAPILQTICIIGLLSVPIEGHSIRPTRMRLTFRFAVLILLFVWSPLFRVGFAPWSSQFPAAVLALNDFPCLAQRSAVAVSYATLDAGEWMPLHPLTKVPISPISPRGDPLTTRCQKVLADLVVWGKAVPLFEVPPTQPRSWLEAPIGWSTTPLPEHSPFSATIAFQLEGREPAEVVINQIYFPGWQVFVDSLEVPRQLIEEKLPPDGRMHVSLAAGQHTLIARYDGPHYGRARNAVVVVLLVVALAYWSTQWHRSRKVALSAKGNN